MKPIYLNRLGNQVFSPTRTPNIIALVTLKVKAVALIALPLITLFFLYLIFSDPKGEKIITYSASSFNKLKISSKQKQSIDFILTNLAQKSKWWLLKNAKEMNKHGDIIDAIHPLKFISFVLSNKKLKDKYLKAILNDRFKRMTFMKGLTQSLQKAHQNNHIEPYLNDFVLSLSLNASKKDKLKALMHKNNWYEFFYLVNKNSKSSRFFS